MLKGHFKRLRLADTVKELPDDVEKNLLDASTMISGEIIKKIIQKVDLGWKESNLEAAVQKASC